MASLSLDRKTYKNPKTEGHHQPYHMLRVVILWKWVIPVPWSRALKEMRELNQHLRSRWSSHGSRFNDGKWKMICKSWMLEMEIPGNFLGSIWRWWTHWNLRILLKRYDQIISIPVFRCFQVIILRGFYTLSRWACSRGAEKRKPSENFPSSVYTVWAKCYTVK